MSEQIYIVRVLRALKAVEDTIKALTDTIQSDNGARCIAYQTEFRSKTAICQAYETLTYTDSSDGRELFHQAGVLFVAHGYYKELIQRVNMAKQEFAEAAEEFKSNFNEQNNCKRVTAWNALREVLACHNHSRVHLKCIYREIVMIEGLPSSLRWYWQHGGWGKQKTMLPADAVARLEALPSLDDTHLRMQIAKLNSMNPCEPVAQRYRMPPQLKVYVGGESKRKMGSLPIVVLCEDVASSRDVELNFDLDATVPPEAKGTRNSKFENEALCPSIDVYRYREEFRVQARERMEKRFS